MKFITFILLFFLFAETLCKLEKTQCAAFGDDCDLTRLCCGKYRCRDYRCNLKTVKDNQVPWAPMGAKCDWFHHCKKGYSCQSHRCILNTQKVE